MIPSRHGALMALLAAEPGNVKAWLISARSCRRGEPGEPLHRNGIRNSSKRKLPGSRERLAGSGCRLNKLFHFFNGTVLPPRLTQGGRRKLGARQNMSKFRAAMFVATIVLASAAGAAVSVFMDSDAQELSLASSPQINTFELMSTSTDLPSQSYAAF
jgi:hypothetical protein